MSKRQLGLMTKEQLQAEQAEKIRSKQTRLDRTRLALAYARQSTKDQPIKNIEAAAMQRDDLIDYAINTYKWPEDKVKLFVENLLDMWERPLEKPRAASGRLDKEFRPGLKIVERYILEDKVGALFVRDISRLFRDEDMINPPTFAKTCKDHGVVIITYDQEFDFNATSRDDLRDFLEEAQAAADYLKIMRRQRGRAKDRKGMRGEYVGHAVPTGFMLDEKRKNYVPNPYWCDTVAWLARRFRELDADFSALRAEIRGVAIFPDLPEDFDMKRIGRIQLRKIEGGYTVAGRDSLVWMLINPANIGHKTYKKRIIPDHSHPGIVDKEDYLFALEHLGKVDLNGDVIEREQRAKRFTQGQKREGLLAGVRTDGSPMITSSQGAVYIFQHGKYTNYTIRNIIDLSRNPFKGSIPVDVVDGALSNRLEEKLHTLVFHAEVEKELGGNPQYGAQAILNHVSALKRQVRASIGQIDKTIAQIEGDIRFKQREYDAAKKVMSDHDIEEHFASRARLQARLADLKEKRAKDNQTDKDIDAVNSRLTRARDEWGTMTLEDKRSFIRLITHSITMDVLSGRWMRIRIEWSPVLAGENYVEYVLLLMKARAGKNWSKEEDATLKAMYPQSSREEIVAALPRRSWHAITLRAKGKSEAQTIMDTLSLEDLAVVREHGIKEEWIEGQITEYWGIEDTSINSARGPRSAGDEFFLPVSAHQRPCREPQLCWFQ